MGHRAAAAAAGSNESQQYVKYRSAATERPETNTNTPSDTCITYNLRYQYPRKRQKSVYSCNSTGSGSKNNQEKLTKSWLLVSIERCITPLGEWIRHQGW